MNLTNYFCLMYFQPVRVRFYSPPLTTESPTTYTTDQHHVPIDPRAAELMPIHAARLALTRSVTQEAVDPSIWGPRSASVFGGASRTPVAEGGGALWKARRSISPREKSGEKSSGQCPRGGSALESALQVAIVVVRERSHLERVGDRCGSLAIRLSQRNSTHMLGASPLTA